MFDAVWNRQGLLESHLTGVTDAVDEDGLLTGEKTKTYSDPAPVSANITPAGGQYTRNVFGSFEDYTHIIVSAEPLRIVKDSLLKYEGSVYRTRRVAHDLNTFYYALEAVNAQNYPGPDW